MLKRRIGAALIIKDDWVVQSIGFKKYLPVGKPQIAVEFLNKWGIDEIFLLDITARRKGKSIAPELVASASTYCRVPLAAGGGITSVQQMEALLHSGADKITLGRQVLEHKELITEGARLYGDQCMVAIVDFVQGASGNFEVYDYMKGQSTGLPVLDHVKALENAGAGEVVLQSVERDGSYNGFELALYQQVCDNLHIPVVALGGAGHAGHFHELLKATEVSAACAGNIFHFTEHSVNMLKAQLVGEHHPVRLETHADYGHSAFDKHGRLLKADDSIWKIFYLSE